MTKGTFIPIYVYFYRQENRNDLTAVGPVLCVGYAGYVPQDVMLRPSMPPIISISVLTPKKIFTPYSSLLVKIVSTPSNELSLLAQYSPTFHTVMNK